jgi:uncharacterized repeat protein (TIGR01451 family)
VEIGVVSVADPGLSVTATLPTSWNAVTLWTPGETASYWLASYTPPAEGLYRFYSRATDVADNQESDPLDWYDGAFAADSTPPVVEWLAPSPGSSLPAPLQLRAQVSDYASGQFSIEDVYFEVDGSRIEAPWAAEPWNPGDARIFWAWVSLANGPHTAIAVAEDYAGNNGQSVTVPFTVTSQAAADTTPPTLNVASPVAGSWVTRTVEFSGTASDTGSGLASVEVSVDGGATFTPTVVSGGNWHLTWQAPDDQQYVSFPLVIRAIDRAGNVTTDARAVTVDNVPPTGLAPVTFSAPEGTHFDEPTDLGIFWNPVFDGSGYAFVLAAVDQISNTRPTIVVSGLSLTETLATDGDWYVHLSVRDLAGNQFTRHYGPWHVATVDDHAIPCELRQQSVIIDGFLDLANNEWRSTEFLGSDHRPSLASNPPNTAQSLYVTWDGDAFYLGWQGAWWTLDGSLWAYLDTASGGSFTGVQPFGWTLPFEADYAIEVASQTEGRLWQYTGGGWQSAPLEFSQGSTGGSEARLPWDIIQVQNHGLNLMAFSLTEGGAPWSVFPNTNPLTLQTGGWTQYYHWDDLCSLWIINDNQPQARNVTLSLDSPQNGAFAWGPGATLVYSITVENLETTPITGALLTLEATPGIGYQSLNGAACIACPVGGDTWVLQLDPLGGGALQHIAVTGQLDANLGSLEAVTTTATIPISNLGIDSYRHRLDGQPPSVLVTALPGNTLGAGLQTITGQANDGSGSGVATVEARPEGGGWQTALGTTAWFVQVNVLVSPTFTLEARATDAAGNVGNVTTVIFNVDETAPVITFTAPTVVTGTYTVLPGTTRDPFPAGSQVARVEVQLDADSTPWLAASGPYTPQPDGTQGWAFTWNLPVEDAVTHTLRVRAADQVGNQALTEWFTTSVDNVTPLVTVTQVVTQVELGSYLPEGTGGPVLEGSATDGGGIGSVVVYLYTPDGRAILQVATLNQNSWQYSPVFDQPILGRYTLQVVATDQNGNRTLAGAFNLNVVDSLIHGLLATNDSPTVLAQATAFTATITTGTNVSYTWNFGDTSPVISGSSAVISHTYPAVGTYTAVVTAANSRGSQITQTIVTVDEIISGLHASNNSPAGPGEPVTFSATVAAGSRVNYSWDFGDGTPVISSPLSVVSHAYAMSGLYTAVVTATNSVGQQVASTVAMVDWPISGLVVINSSPADLGETVIFTATVMTGTNYLFTWDFGDNQSSVVRGQSSVFGAEQSIITHTYATAGYYTAVVTATNAANSVSGDTLVRIIAADLQLTKQVSNEAALIGSSLTYTLTLTNLGPFTATQVILTDTLPAGLTFEGMSPSSGQCQRQSSTSQTILCSLDTLAPGETNTVMIEATVDLNAIGSVVNTALASVADPDPHLANNIASATTDIIGSQTVYFDDFEDGAGPEWCNRGTDTAPNGQNFLGQLGNETECLTLSNLPAHRWLSVTFDLYLIRSWDGNTTVNTNPLEWGLSPDYIIGPDIWEFGLGGGDPILRTTFSNWPPQTQSYPDWYPGGAHPPMNGATEVNSLGYLFDPYPMDSVYRLTFLIPHSGNTLQLDFSAFGLQVIWDESWGLDNVQVMVVNQFKTFLPILRR